jgi:NAD(P)-dependent dehydrogenase (short-subunit alcohol dehydrogenase family)
VAADVTTADGCTAGAEAVRARPGGIDILFVYHGQHPMDAWTRMVDDVPCGLGGFPVG